MEQANKTTEVAKVLLKIVRFIAEVAGGMLVMIGCYCCAWGLIMLWVHRDGPDPALAEGIRYGGYFVAPGWLLLRFAAGLFPFSKRFSEPSCRILPDATPGPRQQCRGN